MNATVFEQELIRALEGRSSGRLHAEMDWIAGNNRARIRVMKLHMGGCRLMPLVYPEDFHQRFEKGEAMEFLADEILDQVEKTSERDDLPEDFFKDFTDVKDRIFCRVINAEKNRQLLREVPHEIQENLAIVYYYEFLEGWMEEATILIRKEHLQLWNRSACEVKNTAWKNTLENRKVKFCKLSQILLEYGMEDSEEMERNPLYLLTCEQGGFGAVTAFFPQVLAECSRMLKADLVLLPSSIHEWLLFPVIDEENYGSPEELRTMVREINRTQVAEKEVLSDEIYYYDARMDRLSII